MDALAASRRGIRERGYALCGFLRSDHRMNLEFDEVFPAPHPLVE
jgi:hypothetical protein